MNRKFFHLVLCIFIVIVRLLPAQTLNEKVFKTTRLTADNEADLQISGWDYRSVWGWGCTAEIAFCEYNNSSQTAASSHHSQIYLSHDSVIDSTDFKIGKPVSFGSIAPGGYLWGSLNCSVPSIDTGAYYIACIVDINNTVKESDENNVYVVGKVNIVRQLPDLIAAGLEISWGESWTVGSDLSFSITEKNAGSAIAGEHYNQLCLFDIYNNTVPIADVPISSTSPGETKLSRQTVRIPLLLNGQYILGLIIDSNDDIDECDEENTYQIPDCYVMVKGGIPVLKLPADGAADLSPEVKLEWMPFLNPDIHYIVQISDDPGFGRIIKNIAGLKDPWCTINGLQNKTKYYWRVAAGPEIGSYSAWSEARNFSTASLPVPVLKYPSNNSQYIPLKPELSWSEIPGYTPGYTKYHLQISLDSTFSSVIFNDSTISSPGKTIGPLHSKKKYYWRLRAGNSESYGDFSDPWCFTTQSEPIAAPSNLTAAQQGSRVHLKWTDNSQNETTFSILRKPGDSLSTATFNQIASVSSSISEYTDSSITSGNTYTYIVCATGIDTISAFSNQAEVKIITLTEPDNNPKIFQVYQNYPNPFNSTTSISFDLPSSCHVRLSLYDLLGREVILLLNNTITPGRYTIRLNAESLTSGQYFFLLEAGERRVTKKLILLK